MKERHELIEDLFEVAIRTEIVHLRSQGGIHAWQVEEAQKRLRKYRLEGKNDELLYYTKHETREAFQCFVECVAIQAFLPGGITFAGNHYDVPQELWYLGEDEVVEEEEEEIETTECEEETEFAFCVAWRTAAMTVPSFFYYHDECYDNPPLPNKDVRMLKLSTVGVDAACAHCKKLIRNPRPDPRRETAAVQVGATADRQPGDHQ